MRFLGAHLRAEHAQRALAVISVVVAAACGQGCATLSVDGRTFERVGPLRARTVVPATIRAGTPEVDAGTDALTDDELVLVQARLADDLRPAVDAQAADAPAWRVGELVLDRCRLRAGAGRAATVYDARCDVRLMAGDVVLARAHGNAVLSVRSRAISQEEARAIRRAVRNPLLSADDATRALRAARDAALAMVVNERVPQAAHPEPPGVPAARAARARIQLTHGANRGDIFDLGEAGAPADAALLVPLLHADDRAVRRAALVAIGTLCDPAVLPEVLAQAAPPDAPPEQTALNDAVEIAAAQLRACAALPPAPAARARDVTR